MNATSDNSLSEGSLRRRGALTGLGVCGEFFFVILTFWEMVFGPGRVIFSDKWIFPLLGPLPTITSKSGVSTVPLVIGGFSPLAWVQDFSVFTLFVRTLKGMCPVYEFFVHVWTPFYEWHI